MICEKLKFDKYLRLSFKLLIISLLNINLLFNYSILIPLLFSIYSLIDINISFTMYLCLIQSFLFGKINIISTFIFRYLLRYKIMLFILAVVVLFIPQSEILLYTFTKIITFINNIDISIKGKPAIIGISIFFLIIYLFKIENRSIKFILYLLIIISDFNNPFFHVTFIDVGQGDSTLIQYGLNQKNILIDTGSIFNYYKLSKTLDMHSVYTIDYLIISHDDSDHNGNIDNLLRDYKVNNIMLEGEDFSLNNIDYRYLDTGKHDNDNDNSLVYLINIEGKDFLFTGDISKDVESILLRQYSGLNADILKIAHHGSDTSSSESFLSYIMPEYVTISTSGQYGHPKKEVLDLLDKYDIRYFITKDTGNISFYFCGLIDFIKTDHNEFVIMR